MRMRHIAGALVATAGLSFAGGTASADFRAVREWGGPGSAPGQFTDLRDVATDGRGHVYTVEPTRIQKFGRPPARALLWEVVAKPGESFRSIAVRGDGASGRVLVVDRAAQRVRAFNVCSGAAEAADGFPTTGGPQFAPPHDIAVDPLGNAVLTHPRDAGVADGPASGIKVLAPNGVFLRSVGAAGPGADDFERPLNVDVDHQNERVAVTDPGKDVLLVFPTDPESPDGPSRFAATNPTWDPDAVAFMVGDPAFGNAATHTIFASDTNAVPLWGIKRSGPPGWAFTFAGRLGTAGSAEGQIARAAGLASDLSQRLFVADAVRSKVIEFALDDVADPTGATGCERQEPPPTQPGPQPAPTVVQLPPPAPPSPPTRPAPAPTAPAPPQRSPLGDRPLVCIGLWSAATCSWLPKPDPVHTCVSLWENCNGFGGSRPAKPGVIDLSGLRSSFTLTAGCDERRTDPFRPRPRASQAGEKTGREEVDCLFETYLTTDDPAVYDASKAKVRYEINAQRFRVEVGAAYGRVAAVLQVLGEIDVPDDALPQAGARDLAVTVLFAFTRYVEGAFNAAQRAGTPVITNRRPFPGCAALDDEDAQVAASCRSIVANVEAMMNEELRQLAQRKATLGVDKPFVAPKPKPAGPRAAGAQAGGRRARPPLVLAAVQARIPQGRPTRIRVTLDPRAAAILRTVRRSGRRTVRARATVRGHVVPAVEGERRSRVTLSLVPVRRSSGR